MTDQHTTPDRYNLRQRLNVDGNLGVEGPKNPAGTHYVIPVNEFHERYVERPEWHEHDERPTERHDHDGRTVRHRHFTNNIDIDFVEFVTHPDA